MRKLLARRVPRDTQKKTTLRREDVYGWRFTAMKPEFRRAFVAEEETGGGGGVRNLRDQGKHSEQWTERRWRTFPSAGKIIQFFHWLSFKSWDEKLDIFFFKKIVFYGPALTENFVREKAVREMGAAAWNTKKTESWGFFWAMFHGNEPEYFRDDS